MFGIIGGVGPRATTEFYSTVIEQVSAKSEGRLPRLLIYSILMTPQIENAFIQGHVGPQSPERIQVRRLIDDAVTHFCRNEVQLVVMPCNTLQDEFAYICKIKEIPHLNMIDETVKAILEANVKRLFVLGTANTERDDLYGRRLRPRNIECVYPKYDDYLFIKKYIRYALDQNLSQELKYAFAQLVADRARGCDGIIIACTDLTGDVSAELSNLPVFDSLQLLAKVSASYILTQKNLLALHNEEDFDDA